MQLPSRPADLPHGLPVGRPFGQPSLSQFRAPWKREMFRHSSQRSCQPAILVKALPVRPLLQLKPLLFLSHKIAEQLDWIAVLQQCTSGPQFGAADQQP